MSEAQYESLLDALRRGAADEAIAAGREAAATAADDFTAHRLLSAALRLGGDNDGALASIDRAIELAPEEAGLYLERGQLLVGTRQLDQAEAALATGIGLDPNQFPAYILQAQMALGRNDLDEASRVVKLAARVAPQHPHVEAIQGMLALMRGETTDALSILSEAVARYPEDDQLLYALGFAHLMQGHLAFAEQTWRRVLERSPAQVGLRALIAQLMLRQGLPTETLAELQPLLAADPVAPAVSRIAGEAIMATGDVAAALPHFRAALAGNPGDRRTLLVTLEAWQRLQAVDEARETLDGLLEASPRSDDMWRARLSLEPSGSQPGRDVIDRWLRARPTHLPALEAAMAAQEFVGDRDAVDAIAQRIVEVNPKHIDARLRQIERLSGSDPAAALAQLQHLFADTKSADKRQTLRYPLALALDRAGDADAAVASWLAASVDAPVEPGSKANSPTPAAWPELAPGMGRGEDADAAFAAWREANAEAPLRIKPPTLSEPRSQWPELGQIPASAQAIGLLWGAPGSVVEDVVVAGMAMRLPFFGDRFSPQAPTDALQRLDTAARLASGELAPQTVVTQWRAGLLERRAAERSFIDWLPWWDNQLLLALRPHLPEGLLMVALRDPRDMLLDWLAFGSPSLLAFESSKAAAQWLASMLGQIATLHEQDLFPHKLMRLDDALDEPLALAGVINEALQTQLPPPPRAALGPQRLPAGRWRHYEDVLGDAFALLAPVAQRLGYEA